MGPDDAARLFRSCLKGLELRGESVEGLLVLGLDRSRSVAGVAVNRRHPGLATLAVWELAGLARELDAWALVLGRAAKGRARVPTVYEAHAFADLAARASRAQLLLLDCIVIRTHQWWSLAERARGDRASAEK
jgi:hypothetical protein